MPPQPPNKVTILKGTPNQAEFFFENPTNPTANDIAKVKKFYGMKRAHHLNSLLMSLIN